MSLLLACGSEGSEPQPPGASTSPYASSVFLLEVSDTEASWEDLAYLAAVPTSTHITEGTPTVLAVADVDALSSATSDLLRRLQPEHAFVLNGEPDVPHAGESISMSAKSASEWSLMLARQMWISSETVVLASEDDYAGAILASSLAAYLGAPLLFVDQISASDIDIVAADLGARTVLGVSSDGASLPVDAGQQLTGTGAVLGWLVSSGYAPQYLTLSNPSDRLSGRSQKASMFAPVYAARRGGISLPLSLEMPTAVVLQEETHPAVTYLEGVYDQLGYHPAYLAIVGAHDALPQSRKASLFDNPVEEHPVSDLPYGEVDRDPFLDIAIGRILGDTVTEQSNLAARTASYAQLLDGTWEGHFIESGLWGFDELRDSMRNVGYAEPEHLSQSEIEARDLLEVGAILHKDHSSCQVLGHAFDIETPTLFAPAVVLSRGCSVGGIDLLSADQRSIVDHMLGSGAVAFVGASRNAIAQNTLIEVSMWNQMLAGHSLGAAFQTGINDMVVHWMDEGRSAAFRYSLDIEILYGDPALELAVPGVPLSTPAQQTAEDGVVTVSPPQTWNLISYHPEQLAEWGFDGDLFMFTGAGASPKTYWAGSHDNEDMYFGVQLRLDTNPSSVEQTSRHSAPLGWGGSFYLDEHQDGSVTALWRVRLLDFDPYTGDILAEDAAFTYRID